MLGTGREVGEGLISILRPPETLFLSYLFDLRDALGCWGKLL